MKETLAETYQQRVAHYETLERQYRRRIGQLAFVRVAEFLLAVVLAFYLAEEGYLTATFLVVIGFGVLFLYLVKVHANLKDQAEYFRQMKQINQQELNSLEGDFKAFSTGEEFIEAEHAYLSDLDIFGQNSIFQLLSRNATAAGRQMLADWLKSPCQSPEEIRERQSLVKSFAPMLDFRQDLQAQNFAISESSEEAQAVSEWLLKGKHFTQHRFYPVMLKLFPLMTFVVLGLGLSGVISFRLVFLPMLLLLLIVSLHLAPLLQHARQISLRGRFLRKYTRIFQVIEQAKFEEPLLQKWQQGLANNKGRKASQVFARISNTIDRMEQGGSFVGLIFNALFMWSLQYLHRLERQQIELQGELELWFEQVAKIDALCSLANFHYNHPQYAFPTISPEAFQLEAKNLAHPLIPSAERVANPAQIVGQGKVLIITGANMAGKSTYLRSVGVNLVLAMSGSPVCAESFHFCPVQLYSSMRTSDSLQANESFFYAELKKLKRIIEALNQQTAVFAILDEILKGTNSADQHTGSKALIEQLLRLKGVGIIATHDISLGELARQYPEQVYNRCFEIEIVQDEMQFDYRLREGINQNLNATFLMRKMGITL